MVENAHRYGATVLTVVLMAFCSARGWTQQETAVTDSLPRMARELSAAPVVEQRSDAVRWMQSIGAEASTGMKSRVFGWLNLQLSSRPSTTDSCSLPYPEPTSGRAMRWPTARHWRSGIRPLIVSPSVRRTDAMADPLGYPEAYYTPPTRAVREVRMVSGAGALQYGSQLGGMLDFVLRDGREHAGLWGSGALSGIVYSGAVDEEEGTGIRGFGQCFAEMGWQDEGGEMHAYGAVERKSGGGWRPNTDFSYHRIGEWRWTPRSGLELGDRLG